MLKLRTVGQEIKLECQKGVRLQIELELRLDFGKMLLQNFGDTVRAIITSKLSID